MTYNDEYMKEHCIDVFFKYRNKNVHVLTDGFVLPDYLNNKELNQFIQQQVEELLANEEYVPNNFIISQNVPLLFTGLREYSIENINGFVESNRYPFDFWFTSYLYHYVDMASLGFYSFMFVWDNELEENAYHLELISSPKNGNKPNFDLLDITEQNGIFIEKLRISLDNL